MTIWTNDYDSAGNRVRSGFAPDVADSGEHYTANALNQLHTREHNKRHLSGTGVPGMKVLAVGPDTAVTAPAAYQGRFWSAEILLNNADAPAKGAVSLYFGQATTQKGDGPRIVDSK
jgi:hypothetical protein